MPRTHEVVLAWVEGELASGRLGLGDRLPGERGLAETLGVGRSSVREATKVLEAVGVVRSATGSGPLAGATVVADPGTGLAAAMRLHTATRHLPVDDLVATRVLLESWAVREAAAHGRAADLAEAEALLDRMDDPALAADDFLALDDDFHLCLARAAGNAVVTAVTAALLSSVRADVAAAVPAPDSWPDSWPDTVKRLRKEHRKVLAAVTSGKADKAAERVTAHVEGWHRGSAAR